MKWILCHILGHRIYIDNVGGTGYQRCTRCNWTGRCVYDTLADENKRKEIIEDNKKYGVFGIKPRKEDYI